MNFNVKSKLLFESHLQPSIYKCFYWENRNFEQLVSVWSGRIKFRIPNDELSFSANDTLTRVHEDTHDTS